ncbi:MAG: HyaD/HybD family hydrogenase maturation endopeptidase [Desulfovibrio sp.]|jgi:hydrogenase maturation protease|nr:HyaD/HybD family hydrogenase maturation endopeptidase [Desulfovibrio sp.]
MSNRPNILVLGVGNILYTDEGIGVRAVEALQTAHAFTDNVTVMDGGTLGMRLMDAIMECDHLIVVDAVLAGDEPGAIYRLTGEDLRKSLGFNDSMHQTDLVDTLIFCELVGKRPEAVIIGMEPHDYQSLGTELSPVAGQRLPLLCDAVVTEVRRAGGDCTPATD